MKMPWKSTFAILSCTCLAACASTSTHPHPDDPYEGYNRMMYDVNSKVDTYAIKPVAQTYKNVTPDPIQSWAGNFLANLGDLWIGANNALQGKLVDGGSDAGRFIVNTTLGLFGLFDVATDFGLSKHDEDFGQTLGVWGVPEGGYFVLPLLGPSTVRDSAALPADWYLGTPWSSADVPARNALLGLSVVNARARLLGTEKTLNEGTLDTYAYVRDFYLQQRRYRVSDGKIRVKREEDDWYEEETPQGQPLPNPHRMVPPNVPNIRLFKE